MSTARTILHVDMDAFYVSVELRRRPELQGMAVVVGGTGNRGVVAAASYEARRFGVFSAMSSAHARRLCPQAVFLPGDHALYAEVSAQVQEIFRDVTPLVEPIALDEAFLDATGALRLLGDGPTIARSIRARVATELQLSCSVGVAPNKFLAKLASQAAKPTASPAGVRPGRGVVEVLPGEELAFLHPLPVQALWGVGPATLERLQRLGVTTVGELATLGEQPLVAALGKAAGRQLHRLAHALDERPVEPDRPTKSIGHEETYPDDLTSLAELRTQVVRLADSVAARLRANGSAARTITLKVRFASFQTITRSATSRTPLTTGPSIARAVIPMLEAIDPTPGIRLLGVSGSNLTAPTEQLSLLDGSDDRSAGADPLAVEHAWHEASEAIDDIRHRFGQEAIGPASTMRGGRLRAVTTGAQQWGPDQGS